MFGKYTTIEAFLDAYVTETVKEQMTFIHTLPLESQPAYLTTLAFKDVVEVNATILKRLPDDTATPKHYQMNITLNQLASFPPDVKDDILESKNKHLPVFLAIRFGDRQGILNPIKTGMNNGDKLHLKGQWITRDNAQSHGGARMSVLHFTHHPLGFTCTNEKCYL